MHSQDCDATPQHFCVQNPYLAQHNHQEEKINFIVNTTDKLLQQQHPCQLLSTQRPQQLLNQLQLQYSSTGPSNLDKFSNSVLSSTNKVQLSSHHQPLIHSQSLPVTPRVSNNDNFVTNPHNYDLSNSSLGLTNSNIQLENIYNCNGIKTNGVSNVMDDCDIDMEVVTGCPTEIRELHGSGKFFKNVTNLPSAKTCITNSTQVQQNLPTCHLLSALEHKATEVVLFGCAQQKVLSDGNCSNTNPVTSDASLYVTCLDKTTDASSTARQLSTPAQLSNEFNRFHTNSVDTTPSSCSNKIIVTTTNSSIVTTTHFKDGIQFGSECTTPASSFKTNTSSSFNISTTLDYSSLPLPQVCTNKTSLSYGDNSGEKLCRHSSEPCINCQANVSSSATAVISDPAQCHGNTGDTSQGKLPSPNMEVVSEDTSQHDDILLTQPSRISYNLYLFYYQLLSRSIFIKYLSTDGDAYFNPIIPIYLAADFQSVISDCNCIKSLLFFFYPWQTAYQRWRLYLCCRGK